MQTAQPPAGNPLLGVVLLIAVVAAIFDFVYWLRGGAKTQKKTRRNFLIVLALLLVLTTILCFKLDPSAAGTVFGILLDVLFIAWEYARWKIRRNKPITTIKAARATTEDARL